MRKMLICLTALILCSGQTCIVVGPTRSLPSIGEYSDSGCLDGTQMDSQEGEIYPGCGEDEIELTVDTNTLQVVHRNALYNCCPDDIEVSLSIEGTELMLTETEILTTPCDCLCCYDVEATVVNLQAGMYTVIFCWHDYETGIQQCHTEDIPVP